MQHIPRKRFGQNFLTDAGIIDAIVRTIAPQPGEHMVEIGPGLAAMTQPLVERLGALTVIELDRDLAARLRSHSQLQVIQADVLKVNFSDIQHAKFAINLIVKLDSESSQSAIPAIQLASELTHPAVTLANSAQPSLRVVGNLPYNISSPILFHLLGFAHLVHDQHFMLQKEVVDRMVASPSTAAYGRLSVMLQWRYAMENMLDVPPESFDPPPRVMSAIVRMVPHTLPAAVKFELLEEMMQVAFSMRRKLLRHSLGRWLEARQFAGSFDLQRRAEEVSVAEFVALAQQL